MLKTSKERGCGGRNAGHGDGQRRMLTKESAKERLARLRCAAVRADQRC